MGEQKTVVTVKGPGVEVCREVSEPQMMAVLRVLLNSSEPAASLLHSGPDPVPDSDRESIAEFFRRIGPKRNPDKILTVAEYLRAVGRLESFTPDDLRRRFKDARLTPPGNFARDLSWAIKVGWIAKDDNEPGCYYVTTSGSKAVSSGFPDSVKKATRIKTVER